MCAKAIAVRVRVVADLGPARTVGLHDEDAAVLRTAIAEGDLPILAGEGRMRRHFNGADRDQQAHRQERASHRPNESKLGGAESTGAWLPLRTPAVAKPEHVPSRPSDASNATRYTRPSPSPDRSAR